MVHRRKDEVGAGDAEERAEEGERTGGGGRQRAADAGGRSCRGQGAQVTGALAADQPDGQREDGERQEGARGRRDGHDLRRRIVLPPTSIERPASAAASRASAIRLLVRRRLDWMSQPAGICFQPWRRRPLSVMKWGGFRPLSAPNRCWAVSIFWTFETAISLRLTKLGMTRFLAATLRSTR